MSLSKSLHENLSNGSLDEKHRIAAFFVRQHVHYHGKDLKLPERRELYTQQIDFYSGQYGLSKSRMIHETSQNESP